MKRTLLQYTELLLSLLAVGSVWLIALLFKPDTPVEFRRNLNLIVMAVSFVQSLLLWSIWSRRRRLKFQLIAAAKHTIHVQAENTLCAESLSRKGSEFAAASEEQMQWYRRGYTRGIKDYEFTLDQLIEPVIRATKEFYPPPGMDSVL
jgi:hypothetical protein